MNVAPIDSAPDTIYNPLHVTELVFLVALCLHSNHWTILHKEKLLWHVGKPFKLAEFKLQFAVMPEFAFVLDKPCFDAMNSLVLHSKRTSKIYGKLL